MFDPKDNRNSTPPLKPGDKRILMICALIGLILIIAELAHDYTPRKLGAAAFLLSWMPLLMVHELGHAFTAHLLNWQVKRTVIGFGKTLWTGRLLNADIDFKAIPLEGFVEIQPRANQQFNRAKHALIYFMGPGVELLIVLLIAAFLGGSELFHIEDKPLKVILQGIAYAALTGAIVNLIPLKHGNGYSDGLGILCCLFTSNADYEQWAQTNSTTKEKADFI